MKLASLAFALLISGPAIAAADDRIPVDPYADPYEAPFIEHQVPVNPFAEPSVAHIRAPLDPFAAPAGAQHPAPHRKQHRKQLRRLLLQHFDRNQDGQLQPRERKQAARALRRLATRMQHGNGPQARGKNPRARGNKLIRRFDLDHDGNLGPGELPPALADALRPLDRDGDGWLHGNELP